MRSRLCSRQIDLKHFKSRRLALRWRTAEEVVDGIGEDTCASLRCKYHRPAVPSPRRNEAMWEDASTPGPSVSERGYGRSEKRHKRSRMPALRAFELPFVYEEAGERKEALVKVKLCSRCQAKLTWKPGKEEPTSADESDDGVEKQERDVRRRVEGNDKDRDGFRRHRRGPGDDTDGGSSEEGEDRRRRRYGRHRERSEDTEDPPRSHHKARRERHGHASGDRKVDEGDERFRPRPLRKVSRYEEDAKSRRPPSPSRSASPSRSRSPPPRKRNLL